MARYKAQTFTPVFAVSIDLILITKAHFDYQITVI